MTYRRDALVDESVPLPIETVYNSIKDAITTTSNDDKRTYYLTDSAADVNQLYFKYPPEWHTANVGEKIIGVRNMKINIRSKLRISFALYIRKYRQDKFNELAHALYDDITHLTDEQIQNVVNRMDNDDCKVFKVRYCNDIFDSIDDFINDLFATIDDVSVYDKISNDILQSDQTKAAKIAALEQLKADADDYDLICLRNDVSFYLDRRNDIDIYTNIGNEVMLTIDSPLNNDYYIDFMITADNDNNTYKKFYMWDLDNDEPLPYTVIDPGELDLNVYDDDDEILSDRFDFDTACYLHIGDNNPHRNSIRYITKFHRLITFKHVLSNLQCEVAASFANQSNHNLIGRTNETYTPIKYYKLNDNDDKFWIELYDRNEIDIPVAFEDFFVFTMDVVLLQNRKLLYS